MASTSWPATLALWGPHHRGHRPTASPAVAPEAPSLELALALPLGQLLLLPPVQLLVHVVDPLLDPVRRLLEVIL